MTARAPAAPTGEDRKLRRLLKVARELDAALDESCEKETALWLDHESSERVYKARCELAEALWAYEKGAAPWGRTARRGAGAPTRGGGR